MKTVELLVAQTTVEASININVETLKLSREKIDKITQGTLESRMATQKDDKH